MYSLLLFTFTGDTKPRLRDLQLMTYGNELNPSTRIHFRLMDQIRPHFRTVAIALNFQYCKVADMERSGDDPVYHLLGEWLTGTNQEEDPRPVTWRTLITALREARLHEAANCLEKYMVELEPCDATVEGLGMFRTICFVFLSRVFSNTDTILPLEGSKAIMSASITYYVILADKVHNKECV